MGLFSSFLKNKDKKDSHKGFVSATVKEICKETADSVSISFDIPTQYLPDFHFVAGQYINLIVPVGKDGLRRSYSICSAPVEILTIGVKDVKKDGASSYLNNQLKVGDSIEISYPQGNFKLSKKDGDFVAFAAGSGITPILSISKELHKNNGKLRLFYGNRNSSSIMFKSDLEKMNSHIQTSHFLDVEEAGYQIGPLTKETITSIIKNDLSLLKAEGFYICGPEPMIMAAVETLKLFGVSEDRIVYELFTTPVLMKQVEHKEESTDFKGIAHIEAMLDGEVISFDLSSKSMSILDKLTELGEDVPYSCKGGVCCTCKAKVTEGKVTMDMNYSLTDKEVAEGFILTCQSHPASEHVKLTYDE
jgi:ring-1,2-phenylacetyl-CoA epoxidase subunit PaaE